MRRVSAAKAVNAVCLRLTERDLTLMQVFMKDRGHWDCWNAGKRERLISSSRVTVGVLVKASLEGACRRHSLSPRYLDLLTSYYIPGEDGGRRMAYSTIQFKASSDFLHH